MHRKLDAVRFSGETPRALEVINRLWQCGRVFGGVGELHEAIAGQR